MKNILITGGAGYIGSHVAEILVKKKYKVFIIDNLSNGYKRLINKQAKFFKVDIKNYSPIRKIINKYKIESVIHFAACMGVGEAEKKPLKYYNNNVIGTLNMIKACHQTNVKNFIFSSSCAVYKESSLKVKETTKIEPMGIYGYTKSLGEKIIQNYCNESKINYGILRYFNVVGSSPTGKIGQIRKNDTLFKNLSIAVLKKKPSINVYGNKYKTFDGTCIRDYIHVYDLSDIHIKVLSRIYKTNKSLILNCGYGKGLSVLQIIKAFEKYTNKKIKIIFKNKRKGDMEKVYADVKKLKKIIKWKPKLFNLNTIVENCIEWEKKI